MLSFQELGWFALAALVLVLTPGPNMIYCISRTLCQGRTAGLLSLAGVLLGITAFLSRSRGWLQAQRWVMGGVLGALAVRIAFMEKQ